MVLTKDVLIDKLVVESRLTRREAVDFVATFFDDIKKEISEGARVKLAGFGSFFLKEQDYHRKRRDIVVDEDTATWKTPSFSSDDMLIARVQRGVVEDQKLEH